MKLLFLALLAVSQGAFSAELRVLSGGAARAFVAPAAQAAGTVHIEYQPMGRAIQAPSAPDVAARYDMAVVTTEVLEKLGWPGGRPLARTGIGVAVHASAPLPDISTAEALKKTLLAAKSVVQINPATGTSGKYVVQLFEKLNIAEQMKPKTLYVDQGFAVAPVGRGEVELGIHQISEILPVPGVRLVGPLLPEFQRYTVYAGVPVPGSARREAAVQFLQTLVSDEAKGRLAAAGYSAP